MFWLKMKMIQVFQLKHCIITMMTQQKQLLDQIHLVFWKTTLLLLVLIKTQTSWVEELISKMNKIFTLFITSRLMILKNQVKKFHFSMVIMMNQRKAKQTLMLMVSQNLYHILTNITQNSLNWILINFQRFQHIHQLLKANLKQPILVHLKRMLIVCLEPRIKL